MRLALSLRRTLGEMAEMPGAEFALWLKFMETEPIGMQRDDMHFALLQFQLSRIAGSKDGKVSDFLLDFDKPIEPEETTPVDYRAAFQQIMNG